jgi:hypothetical protein
VANNEYERIWKEVVLPIRGKKKVKIIPVKRYATG